MTTPSSSTTTSTSSLEASITLKITETSNDDNDDDEEMYGAFTYVKATVFRCDNTPGASASLTIKPAAEKLIGEISGFQVNRHTIPTGCFWETFDEHSADMEWVAGSLLENKYGRTKLLSLREAGDDPEFDFFFIQNFRIDKNESCDVATFALRKFLYSKQIKGDIDYGCWCVSSVAFVLSGDGNNSSERRSNRYHESIPFLRNGFFQDKALVGKDPDNARILVGAIEHFEKNLQSETEMIIIANKLFQATSSDSNRKTSAEDAEILKRVKDLVETNYQTSMTESTASLSRVMLGMATYVPQKDCTSDQQLKRLQKDLTKLVQSGGSIARSLALHFACEKNSVKVVNLLLQMDADSSKTKDSRTGRNPLTIAAIHATGRLSITGIDDTEVIDALLLTSSSARKSEVDSVGMTAYGYFTQKSKTMIQMTHYQHRRKITDLEHKLYPPGGPTIMDFAGGRGRTTGFVDYGPEDDEADQEMGIGAYASDDEDEDVDPWDNCTRL